MFNLGAEHTTRTAPVQWTQSCQPRPDPSVESEDTCAILGAPIGGPEIERQADVAAVESNRTVKADVQEKGGAISGGFILGTPIGSPEIEHQADIRAVELNRAIKADVQKQGGAILDGHILGARNNTPEIEHQAGNAERQSSPL